MPTAPLSILLLDDADTCGNLADILTDLGHRVDSAHEPGAALALAGRTPYDVALLECQGRGVGRLDPARAIARLQPGLAILIVTAGPDGPDAAEARSVGAEGVVSKPFHVPSLLSRIARMRAGAPRTPAASRPQPGVRPSPAGDAASGWSRSPAGGTSA